MRQVFEAGQTLHGAAGGYRESVPLEGRGLVYVVRARTAGAEDPPRQNRWAVRHYVRGGRVAPKVLGDRYLRAKRPRSFIEAEVSVQVGIRGIPTPKVVAAATYPRVWFYRADLVTEFIPNSTDLVRTMFGSRQKGLSGSVERRESLRASGRLIRQMAGVGVHHPDLHAGNLLLQWAGSLPRAHLLDLDRVSVTADGSGVPVEPMLRRLRRSLRKWERRTGLRLTEREWTELEPGAGS